MTTDEQSLKDKNAALHRRIAELEAVEQESLKIAEELLRERDLSQRIVETSPAGITVCNRDGAITFANRQAEQILGLSRSEIQTRKYNEPAWHITTWEGDPFSDENLPFSRVKTTQQPDLDNRHAIQWPDGRRVLLSINATPLFSEAGEFDGMVAAIQDSTAYYEASKALAESDARYRIIVEVLPVGMHFYALNLDGRLIFSGANPAADEILGVDNGQFIGLDIIEAFPNLSETEVPERYRNAATTGEGWQTEQIAYKDKQVSGAFRVYAFQTEPNQMAAAFVDITTIRQAEQSLRASEERYRHLFEHNLAGVYQSTLDGRMLDCNDVFIQMMGYDSLEDIQQQRASAFHPTTEHREAMLEQLRREGQLNAYECLLRRKDGSQVWVLQSVLLVEDEAGVPAFLQGTVIDITQLKQVEQRARELAVERERIAVLERFINEASHDLKTPLTSMMFSLGVARRTSDPEKQQEHLDILEERLDDMQSLLDSLMTVARLEQVTELQPRDCDLNQLVQGVIAQHKEVIAEKRHTVTFSADVDPLTMHVDWQRLSQALGYILNNALHYTPDGGTITVQTTQTGHLTVVEIQDNGIGISPDNHAHIFKRFYRVDPARNTAQGGMGLGLTLARKIVEAHGGTIEVESALGTGSTFRVVLPATFT